MLHPLNFSDIMHTTRLNINTEFVAVLIWHPRKAAIIFRSINRLDF
jgi:hypothetical protein